MITFAAYEKAKYELRVPQVQFIVALEQAPR